MLRFRPCQALRITLSSSLISLKRTRWSYTFMHTTTPCHPAASQPAIVTELVCSWVAFVCMHACGVCSFSCKFFWAERSAKWFEQSWSRQRACVTNAGLALSVERRTRVVNFYCYNTHSKYRCWIDRQAGTYRCCFVSKISLRRNNNNKKWNFFRMKYF